MGKITIILALFLIIGCNKSSNYTRNNKESKNTGEFVKTNTFINSPGLYYFKDIDIVVKEFKEGTMFENAFNRIMGIDYSSLNYESNDTKIAGKYKGKLRNTIPDGIFDLVIDEYYSIFKVPTPFPKSSTRYPGVQFAEVKAMDGTLYSGSNQGQISSMLYAMSINNGVNQYGGQFIIGTTSDTKISPNIVAQGLLHNIQVVHITAQYRMINKFMEVRLYNGGASPSTTFIK